MRYFSTVVCLFFMSAFLGCSEDGDSVGLNKAVEGLEYRCSSGKSGVTDKYGKYQCEDGDEVTFFIDSIELNTISASDSAITPASLFEDNKSDAEDMVKLLQERTLVSTSKSTDENKAKQKYVKTQTVMDMPTAVVMESKISKSTPKKEQNSKSKDEDIELIQDLYPSFIYRAWGMGGDAQNSKIELSLAGKTYTVLAYSDSKNITPMNASTAGDVTTIIITVQKDGMSQEGHLTISKDYLESSIVLKAYASTTSFDRYTLRGFSSENVLKDEGTYLNFGILEIK